jgi:hypothetical protein
MNRLVIHHKLGAAPYSSVKKLPKSLENIEGNPIFVVLSFQEKEEWVASLRLLAKNGGGVA